MLYSAHLGNGLSVWRPGENEYIAHISNTRQIKYRSDTLTKEEKAEIEELAKTDNRTVSISQDEKVFTIPPILDREFYIVQESRKNKGELLLLVDRSKWKDNWWTTNIEFAMKFTDKLEADKRVQSLKYNSARVVPYDKEAKVFKVKFIQFRVTRNRQVKSIFAMTDYEYKDWLGGGNDGWSEFDGGSGTAY